MDAVQESVEDDLVGNSLQTIILNHDVIAIPSNPTTQMQQKLIEKQQDGSNFVCQGFCWFRDYSWPSNVSTVLVGASSLRIHLSLGEGTGRSEELASASSSPC